MQKQIVKINASSLPWMKCSLEWYRKVIEGYKPLRGDAAPIYGVAVHKFLDVMMKTKGDMGKAVEAMYTAFRVPKNDDKRSPYLSDERHLTAVAFDTWSRYVSKDQSCDVIILPDGLPASEITFDLQGYYEDEWIRVDLAGTIDMDVKIKNGCFAVRDFKTTRQDFSKSTYLEDYEMSQQLRFYVLVHKLMAQLYPDSALGQIGKNKMGAFIDGISIGPNTSDIVFKRSTVFQFSDEDLAEFQLMLDRRIRDISLFFQYPDRVIPREGIFNQSCNRYGKKCEFWLVCKARNNEIKSALLERDFRKVPYDPLNHND